MDRKSSENCNVVCCQLLSLANVVKSKSGSKSAQVGVLIGNDLDDLLKKSKSLTFLGVVFQQDANIADSDPTTLLYLIITIRGGPGNGRDVYRCVWVCSYVHF